MLGFQSRQSDFSELLCRIWIGLTWPGLRRSFNFSEHARMFISFLSAPVGGRLFTNMNPLKTVAARWEGVERKQRQGCVQTSLGSSSGPDASSQKSFPDIVYPLILVHKFSARTIRFRFEDVISERSVSCFSMRSSQWQISEMLNDPRVGMHR